MPAERRFQGAMSEGYLLIRRAIPQFEEIERLVAEAVAAHSPAVPVHVLDVGCGDGVTSQAILARRPSASVTALDSEESMAAQATENLADYIRAGRCQVVLRDALEYLRGQPNGSFDLVASALALHNLQRDYRHAVHGELYRVLKPGGLLVNFDKYVENEEQRIRRLLLTLERFFDTFVPLGKIDLLRASVLHEVADEAPDRLMPENDAVRELAGIGFGNIEIRCRHPMGSLLVAKKPGP